MNSHNGVQALLRDRAAADQAQEAPSLRSKVSRRALAVGLPIVVGAVAAWYAWHTQRQPTHLLIDFDQNYAAARFLRQGRDPYALIGSGREFEWAWPLFYPLTTAVAALPFTLLPMGLAAIVFAAIRAAVFLLRCNAVRSQRLGAFWLSCRSRSWSPSCPDKRRAS
jgi:hypothetical protein